MNTAPHFSSATDNWSTPRKLFADIDRAYGFTLDVAADADNATCSRYYDRDRDGLSQPWAGERVWCNPPYGRELPKWVAKAYAESGHPDTVVVLLIPARTDTTWFHSYIYNKPGVTVRFLKGRIKFGNARHNAPFPTMLVEFKRNQS